MTYIEQFETELRKQYNEAQDEEVLFHWICEKVLESYRNGITAGQKGAKVIRKGESRRPPAFPLKLNSPALELSATHCWTWASKSWGT